MKAEYRTSLIIVRGSLIDSRFTIYDSRLSPPASCLLQRLAHLGCQIIHGERLLKEVNAFV